MQIMNQKIVPHFWFDKQVVEAIEFYKSVFPNTHINFKNQIKNTPSGDCDIVGFSIMGYEFMAIGAGQEFTPNPSISMMVNFDPSQMEDARKQINIAWEKLVEEGTVLMPLDKYPFSDLYGWIQDKYGFSWQLIYTSSEGEKRPFVIPSLLFVTDSGEIAEEAIEFYVSVFKKSKKGILARYPKDFTGAKEGSVMFADFMLEKQWFAAMDGLSNMHKFNFNEAVSFIINCKGQEEIDYFWKKLSAISESEQCGWIKDKFGLSWQIIPENMNKLMAKNLKNTTAQILKMKKIIIKDLDKPNS